MTVSSTSPTSSSSSADSTSALTSLAGNFNDFLSLLTTQLQNQDPTAPMDTSQFTSQLVQFTGVAEQITANTTLSSILAVNQTQQLNQATALVGDKVTFTGGTLPLQSGSAQVNYQTTAAEPVLITVTNSAGTTVRSDTVNATSGSNSWTWDGTDSAGKQLADGSYNVTVTSGGTAVPFQAVGTVTGAEQVSQAVQLEFGSASVPYSQIVSIASASE